MFFASETIGDYFAGRIHIRYLFYFIPVFYMFALWPKLKEAKLGTGAVALLAFLTAMFATVSFTSLLSGGNYCVDALDLSYIIFSDGNFNSRLFAQVAVMTYMLAAAFMIYKNGFRKKAKAAVAVFAAVTVLASNAAGYVMNLHNTEKAMSKDVAQVVELSAGKLSALVPMYGEYFDNALSVLDCSLREEPFCISLEDLCAGMGDYGLLKPLIPSKYWVENPVNEVPVCEQYLLNSGILSRSVMADGAAAAVSANGYYASLTPSEYGKLFHSVLVNDDYSGSLEDGATLWIFDETLLSQEKLTVYFNIKAESAARLVISTDSEGYYYNVGPENDWIFAELSINGGGVMKVSLSCEQTEGDMPCVITYQVK